MPDDGLDDTGFDDIDDETQRSSRSTNTKAVASFVLGVIGLTGVLFVAAIVAIVLGKRSRAEMEASDQRGGGLAGAGVVLGWIGLIWPLLFSVYFALSMTEVF